MSLVVKNWRLTKGILCSSLQEKFNAVAGGLWQPSSICKSNTIVSNCFICKPHTSLPTNNSPSAGSVVKENKYSKEVTVTDRRKSELQISSSESSGDKPAEHYVMMAKVLNCTEENARKLSARNKFLYHLDQELLQEKVNLLHSYGLSHSDIIQNIRVCYKVSASLLSKRLKILQERSLLNSNTIRFLEGENKDFDRAIDYIHDKRVALEGCADLSEYIKHRLRCSEREAKTMLSSPPFSRGYTSIKLKTLIDFFLLEAKVTPQFLIENSFLFTFSLKRLRYRLNIMTKVDIINPTSMKTVWFMSTKRFNDKFQKYL